MDFFDGVPFCPHELGAELNCHVRVGEVFLKSDVL